MKILMSQILVLLSLISVSLPEQFTQYPQGYYPFEESPAKVPPKVRKPPYLQTHVPCPGAEPGSNQEQTLDNLCGDLNKGYLPLNPIKQSVNGDSYPFDLIKAKTLEFFSKTLPILKADDTLPKVAKFSESPNSYPKNGLNIHSVGQNKINFYHHRSKREVETEESPALKDLQHGHLSAEEESTRASGSGNVGSSSKTSEDPASAKQTPRQGRGWCNDSYGVICMIFNAFKGDKSSERDADGDIPSLSSLNSLETPMTPCPSTVEYVTPVFAKNYQGVWRYVVQIPYEGYFTQTVEVVKCLSTKCAYLDGSCLASPRWVSLLVAEIYYPDATFPDPSASFGRKPVKGGAPPSDYNKLFSKRSGSPEGATSSSTSTSSKCDGSDELGCFQVRLYYDWFLIPGSCKCWKNDFFEQYTKK